MSGEFRMVALSGGGGVGAPALEKLFHVWGGGGGEKHLFACAGMGEAEGAGVERLSRACRETVVYKLPVRCRRGAAQYLVTAISGIIEKRMADVAHVDAYLMGASGTGQRTQT